VGAGGPGGRVREAAGARGRSVRVTVVRKLKPGEIERSSENPAWANAAPAGGSVAAFAKAIRETPRPLRRVAKRPA